MFPLVALLSVCPLLHSPSSRRPSGLTILLVLRQKLRDPIVRGLPNYGNLINLFKSSALTAFVLSWDLLRVPLEMCACVCLCAPS